jgi:pSer/pThr/pTyr-binding forkhead associated (FHA) protein
MPSLVFLAGPIAGRRYRLAEGEYVIGRRSDSQIFVPDMRVSRQHARLWKDGEAWALEDLGSNNGTFINGVRIEAPTALKHDDEIAIANNRIRVEAAEASEPQKPAEGSHVTIVDVAGQSLLRSREESASGRVPMMSSGLISISDQRAIRLIERKLEALTQVLHATASSDSAEMLVQKLVDALLDLFPQAEDVGVLVEDERTGELRVQCQRHRKAAFGGDLRVPGTIIQHVVSDRRSILLGDSNEDEGAEVVGTRMGAPLIYCRRSRPRPAWRCTPRGSPRSSRVANGSSAICASRGRSSAACSRRTCRRSSASTSPCTTSRPTRSAATSTTSSGTTRRTSASPSATSPARRSARPCTWRG